eukprot:1076773-Rhodomonas_salina.1
MRAGLHEEQVRVRAFWLSNCRGLFGAGVGLFLSQRCHVHLQSRRFRLKRWPSCWLHKRQEQSLQLQGQVDQLLQRRSASYGCTHHPLWRRGLRFWLHVPRLTTSIYDSMPSTHALKSNRHLWRHKTLSVLSPWRHATPCNGATYGVHVLTSVWGGRVQRGGEGGGGEGAGGGGGAPPD